MNLDRTAFRGEVVNQPYKILQHCLGLGTNCLLILSDQAIQNFDVVDLSRCNTIPQPVEISPMPFGSTDCVEERIMEIVFRFPVRRIQHNFPHGPLLKTAYFKRSRAMIMRWTSLVPS